VTDLEKKRCDVLKEVKCIEKMGKKLDDDLNKAQDVLKHARNMEEQYVNLIQENIDNGIDPQLIRNIEFTVPTAETLSKMYIKNPPYMDKNRDEVMATQVENIAAAKSLLENDQSPMAMETVIKLMTRHWGNMREPPHHEGLPPMLVCVNLVLPLKLEEVRMTVLDLIASLIPGLQRFEG
jgi:hypothetical protein